MSQLERLEAWLELEQGRPDVLLVDGKFLTTSTGEMRAMLHEWRFDERACVDSFNCPEDCREIEATLP